MRWVKSYAPTQAHHRYQPHSFPPHNDVLGESLTMAQLSHEQVSTAFSGVLTARGGGAICDKSVAKISARAFAKYLVRRQDAPPENRVIWHFLGGVVPHERVGRAICRQRWQNQEETRQWWGPKEGSYPAVKALSDVSVRLVSVTAATLLYVYVRKPPSGSKYGHREAAMCPSRRETPCKISVPTCMVFHRMRCVEAHPCEKKNVTELSVGRGGGWPARDPIGVRETAVYSGEEGRDPRDQS